MPSAGIEPATATVERPQAYALERTVTGIVGVFMYSYEPVSLQFKKPFHAYSSK
jgi:hypothetical protein